MAAQAQVSSPPRRFGAGKLFTWIIGIACFGLLGYMLIAITHQIVVPPPAARLVLVQDIPLPSGLGATSGPGQTNPLAPGVEEQFDGFDFQAYDAATHQLFIAHTGPNPDDLALEHVTFDPNFDGNVMVYNTQQEKTTGIVDIPKSGGANVQEVEPTSGGIVARIDIPQVAGLVDVPDLGKVFAADNADNIIYDINVHTLKATPIALPDNEGPDSIAYDPDRKLIFVTDPGSPATDTDLNPSRSNMNVAVIDPLHDKLLKLINIGNVPLLPGENTKSEPHAPTVPVVKGNIPVFGHDEGLINYDSGTHMFFLPSSVLADANSTDPFILPPTGTGEFFEINPVTLTIAKEIDLPATCSSPNGLAIDSQQEVGFIGCSDFSNPPQNLFENIVRVDLRTMTVIPTDPTKARLAPGPDIMVIDQSLHILFVGCAGGVSIFDEKAGEFHKLSDVLIGKETHTIAVVDNAQTHETEVFLPMIIGGRPVLRIARYNPNGV
jgi:DNA-binding beta-propeller fold protein YncE